MKPTPLLLILIAAIRIVIPSALAQPSRSQDAQAEAVKKYPDLAKSGSAFNLEFTRRFKNYQTEKPDYFKDPKWPLSLAEEVSIAAGKPSAGASPSSAEATKPIWILDGKPFVEPTRPNPLLNFRAATATGQLVFSVEGTNKDLDARTELAVVKGMSGEVLKRTEIPKPPSGMNHWIPASALVAGEQVLICMVQWREDESKKRHATLVLRKFDAATGNLSDAKSMSFDDPTQSAESGPVAWSGSQCVMLRVFGQQALISNGYFIAALDVNTMKLLSSYQLTITTGFRTGSFIFYDKGAKWPVTGSTGKYYAAEVGSAPKEITKEEYNALVPVQQVKAAARVNKEGKFLEVAKSEDSTWSRVEMEIPDSLQWVTTDFSTGKVSLVKVVASRNFYCAIPLE